MNEKLEVKLVLEDIKREIYFVVTDYLIIHAFIDFNVNGEYLLTLNVHLLTLNQNILFNAQGNKDKVILHQFLDGTPFRIILECSKDK